ncbi:MAG: DcaP family trimeric outer membrane transporter [Rikenellaceae bacterium]
MKTIRLLIALMLMTTSTIYARDYLFTMGDTLDEITPRSVIIVGGEDAPQLYHFTSTEKAKEHVRERKTECDDTRKKAIDEYMNSFRTGYQSVAPPMFLLTHRQNKFTFGVGGYINLRTSYDFKGLVQSPDFITADIPVPGDLTSRQQLVMDASTSRVYLRGIANSRALGQIEIYIDMDFHGSTGWDAEGVTNSYTPRLRYAYVSFLGLTIGRDATTFCDLNAAPQTVDFEGPNAYSFNYATMMRYQHSFCNDRMTAAIAVELPSISGTYDEAFSPIPQRVPDIPMYIQCRLGADQQHHIRASAVLRNMYMNNNVTDNNTSLLGWGVKMSGRLQPLKWFGLCFNGTYGEGITNYIQDLNGSGLDFTPNPSNPEQIQTMPMWGWQAAGNINFTDRLVFNAGYSTVQVEKKNGYVSDDQYKSANYLFGNIFYNITPRFIVAVEYLYGSRRTMDESWNQANRLSLMTQFNF